MDETPTKKLFDVKDIWPAIWRRKWLIILPWIIVTATVYIGAKFLTPQYRADSIIMIDREVRLSEELQNLLGMGRGYNDDALRDDELRGYRNELISSQFISDLAVRLKLDKDPKLLAQAEQVVARTPEMTKEQAIIYILQGSLAKNIFVNHAGGKQIRISAESSNPAMARDITNTLSELFVEERLKEDVKSIRSSQDFSSVQLQKYKDILEEKTKEKTNFEKSIIQSQFDSSIVSKGNYDQIQSEIDQTEQDISDTEQEERDLMKQLENAGIDPTKLSIKESDIKATDKKNLKDHLRSVGDMVIKYPWNDPQMLNYHLKQDSLMLAIENDNKKLVGAQYSSLDGNQRDLVARLFTVRDDLDIFEIRINYLKSSLDQLKAKANEMLENRQKLDKLNREIATITELRDKFAKQQEGSSLSEALLRDMSSTKYRIVEPAKLPVTPVRPDRMKISLMGFMLGMIIGLAAGLVAELFDSSIKTAQEIKEYTNLPILAVVPKIDSLKHFKAIK